MALGHFLKSPNFIRTVVPNKSNEQCQEAQNCVSNYTLCTVGLCKPHKTSLPWKSNSQCP